MIEHTCLDCRTAWTDMLVVDMPPPGRTRCHHCGSRHLLLSALARLPGCEPRQRSWATASPGRSRPASTPPVHRRNRQPVG